MKKITQLSPLLMSLALSFTAQADPAYSVEMSVSETSPWFDFWTEDERIASVTATGSKNVPMPLFSQTDKTYLVTVGDDDNSYEFETFLQHGIDAYVVVKPVPERAEDVWVSLSFSYAPSQEQPISFPIKQSQFNMHGNWIAKSDQIKSIPFELDGQKHLLSIKVARIDSSDQLEK